MSSLNNRDFIRYADTLLVLQNALKRFKIQIRGSELLQLKFITKATNINILKEYRNVKGDQKIQGK